MFVLSLSYRKFPDTFHHQWGIFQKISISFCIETQSNLSWKRPLEVAQSNSLLKKNLINHDLFQSNLEHLQGQIVYKISGQFFFSSITSLLWRHHLIAFPITTITLHCPCDRVLQHSSSIHRAVAFLRPRHQTWLVTCGYHLWVQPCAENL